MKSEINLRRRSIWKLQISANRLLKSGNDNYRYFKANILLWSRIRNKRFHQTEFKRFRTQDLTQYTAINGFRVIIYSDKNYKLYKANELKKEANTIHVLTQDVLFDLENLLIKMEKLIF